MERLVEQPHCVASHMTQSVPVAVTYAIPSKIHMYLNMLVNQCSDQTIQFIPTADTHFRMVCVSLLSSL